MAILLAMVCACGGGSGGAAPDATTDAALDDAPPDVPVTPLTSCPTTGAGAVVPSPGSSCFALTPHETGASAVGENADEPSYALTAGSATAPRQQLVLFFHGSGGHPAQAIADPAVNFYNTATALGYDVLAISYVSEASIASQCGATDACYLATRESIVLGVAQPGAAADVQSIGLDAGAADRIVLALRSLAARDPGHRWADYLAAAAPSAPPESRIAWTKIVAAGHSQGGGHAALLGKLFPLVRVIQLSSVCDAVGGAPVSWTNGTAGAWATDPTQFYGLGAATTFATTGQPDGGDTLCARHAANWQHLGMVASHQHDDAATCGATTAAAFHAASLKCTQNQSTWTGLLE